MPKFFLEGREFSLTVLDGSLFSSDTFETLSFFFSGFELLLLNLKLHFKPHFRFFGESLISCLLIILFGRDLSSKSFHFDFVFVLHFFAFSLLD